MTRSTSLRIGALAFVVASLIPAAVWAQGSGLGSIAGVVKDTSGAVLPGVTVEASSSALIEKVRTVLTDGDGAYKIIDLRPGDYTVTFGLAGFNMVKRDGIELSSGFTANVNAEMRLGTVEETITVSGRTSDVDIQGVTKQSAISNRLIESLPTPRSASGFAPLLPGVEAALGGIGNNTKAMAVHGSRSGEAQTAIDGFVDRHVLTGGGANIFYHNQASVEEISIQLGAASAEQQFSGVFQNVIPKEGGNLIKGTAYAGYANESLQGDNLTAALKARGLTAPAGLKNLWEVNPAVGGAIVRDKLWFFSAYKNAGTIQYITGLYFNQTPLAWSYTPDVSRRAFIKITDKNYGTRLTWQASPKNKFNVYYEANPHTVWQRNYAATVSPEATTYAPYLPNYFAQATWKSPVSSRVYVEAGTSLTVADWNPRLQIDPVVAPTTIAATESNTGMQFRAAQNYGHNVNRPMNYRGSVSYVTGSHAMKVGFVVRRRGGSNDYGTVDVNGDMTITLLNGLPRSLTLYTPYIEQNLLDVDGGPYFQDQWTLKHLTLNLGGRVDFYKAHVPAQDVPAGRWVPARSFAEQKNIPNWTDFSPRLGMAYDLFGNGKTAFKATLSRFITSPLPNPLEFSNPVNAAVTSANRTWTDSNGDFTPNCDMSNPAANGECGVLSNLNFGKQNPAANQFTPDLLTGFGKRTNNWETSATIQHQIRSGLSAELSYFRRWYNNKFVTDNTAVGPANYDPYCITAPADARLPNGGGNQLCGLYDLNPSKVGQVTNLVTLSKDFGKDTEIYTGFDLTTTARFKGALVSGGMNTGRTATNTCYVIDSPQQLFNCKVTPPFRAQYKFYAVYPLPFWGLQTSAAFQSIPGPEIRASYVATNAQIAPSLGRNLSAGAAGTATFDLIPPGTLFGSQLTQLDFRVAKTVKIGRARMQGIIDAFNILNGSGIQSVNTRYGPDWQKPTQIIGARYLRLGVQLDF